MPALETIPRPTEPEELIESVRRPHALSPGQQMAAYIGGTIGGNGIYEVVAGSPQVGYIELALGAAFVIGAARKRIIAAGSRAVQWVRNGANVPIPAEWVTNFGPTVQPAQYPIPVPVARPASARDKLTV